MKDVSVEGTTFQAKKREDKLGHLKNFVAEKKMKNMFKKIKSLKEITQNIHRNKCFK